MPAGRAGKGVLTLVYVLFILRIWLFYCDSCCLLSLVFVLPIFPHAPLGLRSLQW